MKLKDFYNDEGLKHVYRDAEKKCVFCGDVPKEGAMWSGYYNDLFMCNRDRCIENALKFIIDAFVSNENRCYSKDHTEKEFLRIATVEYLKKKRFFEMGEKMLKNKTKEQYKEMFALYGLMFLGKEFFPKGEYEEMIVWNVGYNLFVTKEDMQLQNEREKAFDEIKKLFNDSLDKGEGSLDNLLSSYGAALWNTNVNKRGMTEGEHSFFIENFKEFNFTYEQFQDEIRKRYFNLYLYLEPAEFII